MEWTRRSFQAPWWRRARGWWRKDASSPATLWESSRPATTSCYRTKCHCWVSKTAVHTHTHSHGHVHFSKDSSAPSVHHRWNVCLNVNGCSSSVVPEHNVWLSAAALHSSTTPIQSYTVNLIIRSSSVSTKRASFSSLSSFSKPFVLNMLSCSCSVIKAHLSS